MLFVRYPCEQAHKYFQNRIDKSHVGGQILICKYRCLYQSIDI